MSWAGQARAIEMRLSSAYSDAACPLVFSDNEEDQPTTAYWARATIRHGSEQDEQLGRGYARSVGVVLFQVFGPKSASHRKLATHADALFAALDGWKSTDGSKVYFPAPGNPNRVDGGVIQVEGGRRMLTFNMPFAADRFW